MHFQKLIKSMQQNAASWIIQLQGNFAADVAPQVKINVLTYGAAIAVDLSLGPQCVVTITNNTAFVVGAPTSSGAVALYGQRFSITFRNTSGGAHGGGTFNAIYKTSAALAAIATAKNRTMEFQWDGTNWVEVFRTAADVDN